LDEEVLRQIERLSLADLGALTDGLTGEHGGWRPFVGSHLPTTPATNGAPD
jgi:hypothetical protein